MPNWYAQTFESSEKYDVLIKKIKSQNVKILPEVKITFTLSLQFLKSIKLNTWIRAKLANNIEQRMKAMYGFENYVNDDRIWNSLKTSKSASKRKIENIDNDEDDL